MKWDICLFSSYSTFNYIPCFTKRYLFELTRFFHTVVFITNQKNVDASSLLFLKNNNILLKIEDAKHHDFNTYCKYVSFLDNKNTMAFVNDSVFLINDFNIVFETIYNNKWDFASITDNFFPDYHFQSYFWFFNKITFLKIKKYFDLNSYSPFTKKDEISLFKEIIQDQDISYGTVFPTQKYIKLKNLVHLSNVDSLFLNLEKYVLDGLPVIERRFIFKDFNRKGQKYFKEIENKIDFSLSNDLLTDAINKCKEKNLYDCNCKKIAVIFHLYYNYMWYRLRKKIKILYNCFNSDIYISLSKDKNNKRIISLIKKEFPHIYIEEVNNTGRDIGAFLQIIKNMNKEYDYIIKIHTKKSIWLGYNKWRQELINSIIGSPEQVERCLFSFEDYRIGMIGEEFSIKNINEAPFIEQGIGHEGDSDFMIYLLKEIGINKNKEFCFVAGSIFWVKYSFIKECFSSTLIEEILNKMNNKKNILSPENEKNRSYYYCISRLGENAIERFFGAIVNLKYNSTIFGINPFDGC